MTSSNQDAINQVMAEGKWLQRLALCLAHDRDDADDMVQETWLAALRASPDARGSMRPWLTQVLRNARRKLWREDNRRRRREVDASALFEAPEVASTDTMLVRLELQRMVAAMVRDLDEPYRTTLLLRFYEGRTPTDMAQSLGIPAGTVRWRLNEGLRRVRAQLDAAHGGNRETWKAAVLLPPLAAPTGSTAPQAAGLPAPAVAGASFGVMAARVAGLALVPALVAGLLITWPRQPRPNVSRLSDPPAAARARVQEPTRPLAAGRPDDPRMSQLLGTVVPALVSAGDKSAAADRWPPPPACTPGTGDCVERIPRAQLPTAAEASLVRLLAGRTPEKLRIEPKIRKGHMTYKMRFEVNDVDEELDIAADGTFIEHQVQLTPADLPGPITTAATAAHPEGTIVRATMNNEGDVSYYELVDGQPRGPLHHRPANRWYGVRVRVGEQIHDLKLAEDGTLLEDKLR
jgi:RNA polymerase sigma-70 factor (ECF subfamily)